jgi:hypothetical protein
MMFASRLKGKKAAKSGPGNGRKAEDVYLLASLGIQPLQVRVHAQMTGPGANRRRMIVFMVTIDLEEGKGKLLGAAI